MCGCQFKIQAANRDADKITGSICLEPDLGGQVGSLGHGELIRKKPWRRYDMETDSTLLTLCEGSSPVTGGFHSHRSSNTFWCFLCCTPERMVKQTLKLPVILPAMRLMRRQCNWVSLAKWQQFYKDSSYIELRKCSANRRNETLNLRLCLRAKDEMRVEDNYQNFK